jgi:hypothetical protein
MALARPTGARILTHEAAFALLYALVIARLATIPAGAAWSEVAVWCAFAAVSAGVVIWSERAETTLAWRVRLGAYLVLMNLAYARMGVVHHLLGAPLNDATLEHVDRLLFGQPVPLYLDRWTSPAASEVFSACYFLLFPYIVVSCGRQLWRYEQAPDEARRFFAGLFTVYGLGFVGYLLVPAAGPYVAMSGAFSHPIAGGAIATLNDAAVRRGSNHVDVFPSLHVAVSAFLLGFDRRFARWRFAVYALPACGLWVSTLYLRYHYGIDVLCGCALAGIGLCVALRGAAWCCVVPRGAAWCYVTLGMPPGQLTRSTHDFVSSSFQRCDRDGRRGRRRQGRQPRDARAGRLSRPAGCRGCT